MSSFVFIIRKILIFLIPSFFVFISFAHTTSFPERVSNPFSDLVVYFNVAKNGYTLDFKWTTSPDADIRDFTIETCQSDDSWTTLDHIKASDAREYCMKSLAPKWSTAYYRLKIIDAKGGYSYTKPVKISMYYRNLDDIMVYPNPLSSNVNTKLKFNRIMLSGTKISVFSTNGVQLSDQVLQKDTEIIELPPLEAGNYFIEIVDTAEVLRLKIAVK
ncbi:T9SS type A sorting domain-containing protein [Fulvivirga ulvae]|uniref:T9SS type A sorting domain-containing protein n=1 Tax=Fulvivirga ulvae TaxID=2904245 RepID=UPI001F29B562|nr:T9SS type A sorting domain-containing protein [Fulvivirga ulvae]UII30362.1 T9SS type A sorting domain-containing protein [Fulvivirga ulvae]